MTNHRRRPGRTALCALALVAGACAPTKIRIESAPGADLAAYDSYDWSPERQGSAVADPGGDEFLHERVQRAVDRNLQARGFRRVAEGPGLLVRQTTQVAVQVLARDPYYTVSVAEQVEVGRLTLEFLDAKTNRTVWRGSGDRRLRTSALGYGLYRLQFVATDEERSWQLPQTVAAILEDFPVRKRS
jgi:hypothetical protein